MGLCSIAWICFIAWVPVVLNETHRRNETDVTFYSTFNRAHHSTSNLAACCRRHCGEVKDQLNSVQCVKGVKSREGAICRVVAVAAAFIFKSACRPISKGSCEYPFRTGNTVDETPTWFASCGCREANFVIRLPITCVVGNMVVCFTAIVLFYSTNIDMMLARLATCLSDVKWLASFLCFSLSAFLRSFLRTKMRSIRLQSGRTLRTVYLYTLC